ncbi:hypothetical protein KP001_14420 [Geomonas subterranea]|uniref:Uncharacterized protein n=1 Tax=Geomonas subterranea TaxID=2847989 RepID=A0ABX8LC83_9BACT|nr:hypothetical protein [Geomonas subterranea]QXE89628.1 hypothetical protein KP001_14420 [Geomonas subterranea]QXM08256.1 hypothetical protein KP002_14860 [Geomonas subterranea]
MKNLLSIPQMAARSGLTTNYLYCGRNKGILPLKWVKLEHAVFATEQSFNAWMKRREEREAARAAKRNVAKEAVNQ